MRYCANDLVTFEPVRRLFIKYVGKEKKVNKKKKKIDSVYVNKGINLPEIICTVSHWLNGFLCICFTVSC